MQLQELEEVCIPDKHLAEMFLSNRQGIQNVCAHCIAKKWGSSQKLKSQQDSGHAHVFGLSAKKKKKETKLLEEL